MECLGSELKQFTLDFKFHNFLYDFRKVNFWGIYFIMWAENISDVLNGYSEYGVYKKWFIGGPRKANEYALVIAQITMWQCELRLD